ncbi:MAG: hypothetical protein IKL96_02360 [Kiritimatiellae bacterium]|nr:hypothetical protein [Kiritimatiellia bacterium]
MKKRAATALLAAAQRRGQDRGGRLLRADASASLPGMRASRKVIGADILPVGDVGVFAAP